MPIITEHNLADSTPTTGRLRLYDLTPVDPITGETVGDSVCCLRADGLLPGQFTTLQDVQRDGYYKITAAGDLVTP